MRKIIRVFHHFPVGLHSSLIEILGVAPTPKPGKWKDSANRSNLRSCPLVSLVSKLHIRRLWSSKSARSCPGWHGECPHHYLQQGPCNLRMNFVEQRSTADISFCCRCWVASSALSNMFCQCHCRSGFCVNLAWKALCIKICQTLSKCDLDSRFVAVFSFALICSSHSTADEVRGSVDSLILFVFLCFLNVWLQIDIYCTGPDGPCHSVSLKRLKVGKKKTELDCS